MKKQVNQMVSANACEVPLFKAMSSVLNQNGKRCVWSDIVHKKLVKFVDSEERSVRCEIADLLLLSLDRRSKKIRLSFLQAKRHSCRKTRLSAPVYRFDANSRQFELLSKRPDLLSGFHTNTLNFSPAESLTTYGVFHNDTPNTIDFFYASAKRLTKDPKLKGCKLEYDTNANGYPPVTQSYSEGGASYVESIAIEGMDEFEKELIAWKIGAVVPTSVSHEILHCIFNVAYASNMEDGQNEKMGDDQNNLLSALAKEYGIVLDTDSGYWKEVRIPFEAIMIVEGDSGGPSESMMENHPSPVLTGADRNSLGRMEGVTEVLLPYLLGRPRGQRYSKAESQLGPWCDHNNVFLLAKTTICCGGEGTMNLRLMRRDQCLGIGYYVHQNKFEVRRLLQQKLANWRPAGLRIAFGGMRDVGVRQGIVFYAYIDSIAPHQLEDSAVNVVKTINQIKSYIRVVAQGVSGVITTHGTWK